MIDFNTFFNYLQSNGFIEYFLPFVLLFAIFYIALSVKVFGGEKLPKNLRTIIAVSFSILITAQHVLNPFSKFDIVPIMFQFLPDIFLLFLAVLFVLMGMGFVGNQKVYHSYATYFTYGAIILTAYLMLSYTDVLPNFGYISDDTISAVISLGVFFLIVKYITGGSSKNYTDKQLQEYYAALDAAQQESDPVERRKMIQKAKDKLNK